MTPRALMIFAAGFGTRMGALTADRPKPMISVAGRPLIDHALALACDAHSAPVVVNTHYRADRIAAHLAGRGVAISHEPAILETGGGLKRALPLLGAGPVMTLNSDAVWAGPNPLRLLADAWDGARMEALLLLAPVALALGYAGPGDFALGADGRLARKGPLAYLGAQVIDPAPVMAEAAEVFSLNRVWDGAIARGRAFGIVYPGRWCDVGRPEGVALAEAMLEGGGDAG